MVKRLIVFITIIIYYGTATLSAKAPSRPFPAHAAYFTGTIKPDHSLQKKLDDEVGDFYTQWKKKYIKNVAQKHESYVLFENTGKVQCVSEGQGYGMIIVALMAGYDRNSQHTYDNLYRYYKKHPSEKSPYLMAWEQYKDGTDNDKTSASDGDMDIAYSLLLANAQWGSKGPINYLKEGKTMINAIMQHEINPKTWTILLSDAEDSESKMYFATRTSDFMPSHFKVFEMITHDAKWQKVIDAEYKLFAYVQNNYSPNAGLVPDFIIHVNKTPIPPSANYLETSHDGQYNYNACRVPWRVATDYLETGDKRAYNFLIKMNEWIRQKARNNPNRIYSGYKLSGEALRPDNELFFSAPFAVSAMIDPQNQAWLDKLWNYLLAPHEFTEQGEIDYFGDTIKLFDMLIISGNYWDIKSS